MLYSRSERWLSFCCSSWWSISRESHIYGAEKNVSGICDEVWGWAVWETRK